MPQAKRSLRAVLGLGGSPNRVRKRTSTSQQPSPRKSPSKARPRKPAPKAGEATEEDNGGADDPDDNDNDDALDEYYFQDRLDDHGLVRALVSDLHLRDVVQAMRYIRGRMWTPMPARAAGMSSARVSEVLRYRGAAAPVVSVAHLQAVLTSPSAVEREVAELVARGVVRRIVVRGRCEALVEVGDLVGMLEKSVGLREETRGLYERFVKGEVGVEELGREGVDELIRAGFLTSSSADGGVGGSSRGVGSGAGLLGSKMSLAHMAKAPTGSLGAVGGRAAEMVTGTGTPTSFRGRNPTSSFTEVLGISVPGMGSYVKLLRASQDHLLDLLDKRSAYREMPESSLREAWDGGLAATSGGKRARGEFSGVLPGRTRKWKEFWGLRFDWVLGEAIGAGVVEMFETGSVGRGVRAV